MSGVCLGKRSSMPKVSEIRFITPLSSLHQILDSLVANRLSSFLQRSFAHVSGLWIGGIKGTQCTDIASCVHLSVERMLDSKSCGGIAQFDIQKYYDSIDIDLALSWLQGHGCPESLLSCIARLLLCPHVELEV